MPGLAARTPVGYRVAIRVVNFSRGYTIALLLLVAVKGNGFLQVKRDRRFITANPLQRRAVLRRGTNISGANYQNKLYRKIV